MNIASQCSFSLPVIERILRVLDENSPGINRTNLAGRTGLNYGACVRYVDLLLFLRWVHLSGEYGGQIRLTPVGREFMLLLHRQINKPEQIKDTSFYDFASRNHIMDVSIHTHAGESVLERHARSSSGSFGDRVSIDSKLQDRGSIMIVEDELDILLTYQVYLREAGFKVYGFSDPTLALQEYRKSREKPIDLVVSDIRMNSINGIQLYNELKSIDPQARIIFISALDAAPEIVSALPGFRREDLLAKPINQSTLLKVVSQAILEVRRSNIHAHEQRTKLPK